MDFSTYDNTTIAHHLNTNALQGESYPKILENALSEADCTQASSIIKQWSGYAPTQLHSLGDVALSINVANVFYKDESTRFGLGSFKALGGAYAVLRLLSQEIPKLIGHDVSDEDISSGKFADVVKNLTVITATDGNHGRSVAWGAQQFGCKCKIYMHPGVSIGRANAIEAFGAEVVWGDGNYDDSVNQAATDAAANEWFIVSDTSYEGYMDLPRHVMAGYTVMTSEIMAQIPDGVSPSHIFVQGGCGGLASAVCSHLWQVMGEQRPRFIVVEPYQADCLYQSAIHERPTIVNITEESIQAGLSCGEVSLIGWEVLSRGADNFMVIDDELVGPTMKLLAKTENDQPIAAGESAVAGLAALIAGRRSEALTAALGLDENSSILILGTEGATDPEIYKFMVGCSPEEVIA